MTPEEILEKHLRNDEDYTQSKVIKAMKEYAKIYHKQEVTKVLKDFLPPDEIIKALGSNENRYEIWHDGGEWIVSKNNKDNCRTLLDWITGGRKYFDTGKTSDDWDTLEKRVKELEAQAEVKIISSKQPVICQRELLVAYNNFKLFTDKKFSCAEESIDTFLAPITY